MAAAGLSGRSPAALGIPHSLAVDGQSGSAHLSIPIEVTEARDSFSPALSLDYRSGGGNGAFGRGWSLGGLLNVSLDLSERLPRHSGDDDFTFSGAGSLVPFADEANADGGWREDGSFRVRRYRPRTERGHLRIERFVDGASGASHWRVRDARDSLTVLGAGSEARIADPSDPARVFSWLPELQVDARGNAIQYEYAAENLDGVDTAAPFEQANLGGPAPAQRYLKRVRWGNSAPVAGPDAVPGGDDWHFELVLDYGDHDEADPKVDADRPWPARPDPFTTAAAGFPVRSYRLCRRLLLFHRFDELGNDPVLVHSYVLEHELAPEGARLTRVRRTGRRTGPAGAETRERPPLDLFYSRPALGDAFISAPGTAAEQVPHGLDGPRYRLVDLWGEGLPGLLVDRGSAWFYRPNRGGGRFGAEQLVLEWPSHAVTQVAVHDFDADGDAELTVLSSRSAGYYSFDRNSGRWSSFQPFAQMPHVDGIHSARWFDADGDGRADLVTGVADQLTWYRCLGRQGFEAGVNVEPLAGGSGNGNAPWRVDGQNDFFFADMTGDGLADQVLVRNGLLIYWPYLGNGRFAAPVTMDGAPRFAPDGEFDAARIVFADLDGSGTSDLIYVGNGEVTVWTNAAGNRLLGPRRIGGLPWIDRHSGLAVYDFLGDGAPCLVWSSHSASGHAPLNYLPLTDGIRPNLLERVSNNLGLEHRLVYSSSAAHYLRDGEAGRPWATRLPRHTTVVDRHEIADLIGGTSSAKSYSYHDGSYDGRLRSLRGFGFVETFDAADEGEEAAGAPPSTGSCVRDWYHLGSEGVASRDRMWSGDAQAPACRAFLIESPAALTAAEAQDAADAVAGQLVRREIFALRGGTAAAVPLRVDNRGVLVRRLQGSAGRWPGVFEVLERESQTLVYEEDPADPRIAHHLVLEASAAGHPLLACDVAYPRRAAAAAADPAQLELVMRVRRLSLLDVDDPDRVELSLPLGEEEFAIEGPDPPAGPAYSWEELRTLVAAALAAPAAFDAAAPAAGSARRLGWSRTFYWDAGGTGALSPGEAASPALVHHRETAVFTPGLVAAAFGAKVDAARLAAAGYADKDGHYWRSSETSVFGKAKDFRRLEALRRSDGGETRFGYDSSNMRVASVTDALGNVSSIRFDYHLLEPAAAVDCNGSVSEVRYDALGIAIASTTHGDVEQAGVQQPYGFAPLAGLALDPAAGIEAALADPAAHLGDAAAVTIYDVGRWAEHGEPPAVVSLARETLVHAGDGSAAPALGLGDIAMSISYFDGFGRALQSKSRVEAGEAISRAADGSLRLAADGTPVLDEAPERWRVSGHVHYDRRQQPVQALEPYFSGEARYEPDVELVALGTATLMSYDALGRLVREDKPNGTFSRTEHRSWSVASFDENDTVGDSAYKATRALLAAGDPERKALEGALAHAGTPLVNHLDPVGRPVLGEQDDALGASRRTRTRYAPDGGAEARIDSRGIIATGLLRDMIGREIRTRSSDSGELLVLYDAMDRPVERWDSRGIHAVQGFDRLDRQTALDIELPGGGFRRAQELVYGEDPSVAGAAKLNLLGTLAVVRDDAGERSFERRTPDGLPIESRQRIVADPSAPPDWGAGGGPALLPDSFESQFAYDGLGRIVREKRPDGVTLASSFERGGGIARIEATSSDGLVTALPVLSGALTNARGQRERLELGNGVTIATSFDPQSWRASNISAQRGGAAPATLLNIDYVYDPVGNIVSTLDKVQQPGATSPLISGLGVSAEREYVYDALYQLRRATGRVHKALLPDDHRTDPPNAGSFRGSRRLSLNDGAQLERFVETFEYDLCGNMSRLRHVGPTASWTSDFWISAASNRSLAALDGNGNPVVNPEARFDEGGNILEFPHLRAVNWNDRGMMAKAVIVDRSAGGQPDDAEYYVYDSDGRRVRKRTERLIAGGIVEATDTLYLDGCEIRRIVRGANPILERLTSHVSDGFNRIASIHRWTRDDTARETDDTTKAKVHYQLADHLGSALIQLDQAGSIVGYEEYLPFGGTAFIAGYDVREIALDSYRFCSKERDDATGFYCFGRRYYAPWLNRWISPDPAGDVDGLNRYAYALNNPVTYYDPDGLQAATKPGRQSTVYSPIPQLVIDKFLSLPKAEQERLIKMGNDAAFYVHDGKIDFGTRAQMAKLKEKDRKAGTNIIIIKPPKPPPKAKAKGKGAGQAPKPPPAANDDDSGGEGGVGGPPAGDATKEEKAKGNDPGQGQDGGGGGAKDPGGGGGGSKGTGDGSDGGGDAADAGDGGKPGDSAGSGEGGGEGKGVSGGTGGDGTGLGEKGKGTGGGGISDVPGGVGSGDGGDGGTGTGTGSASGEGTADEGTGQGGSGGDASGTGDDGGGTGDGADGGQAGGIEGGKAGGTGTAKGNDDPGKGGEKGDPSGKGKDPNGQPDAGVPGVDGKSNEKGSGQTDGPDGKGPGTSKLTTPGGNGKGQALSGQGENQGDAPKGDKKTGSGDADRTIMDRVVKVAGYTQLEFSDDPRGKSGGVPGGFGTHNWGAWGQALYTALAVVDVVITFLSLGGTAGIKAGFKAAFVGARKLLTSAAKLLTKEGWKELGAFLFKRGSRRMFSSATLEGVERASPELIEAVSKKRTVTIAKEGSDDLRFLNAMGAEASVGGEEMTHILLRENPSKAAVLEEFLHGTQKRLGIIDELGTRGFGSAETHVKDFMIRHRKLLGLGDEDVAILKKLMEMGL